MTRVLASDLGEHAGKTVKMRGWLNNVRPLGKLNFLILRDRSGFAQVVIEDKQEFQKISHLQPGTILRVEGEVSASSQADLGVELINPKLTVEVPITEVPPVEYNKPEIPSDLEFILDHRSISLRNRQIQAVFKIQAEMTHAYRLYMHDETGAVEYFAPNILGASSEGGAEFFNVDYFGYTATLAQSSQLYKQIMVGVNERVFALMPFFRAEKSQTTRHLTEGKQFEFEMGFFDHWHDVLDCQEGCIKFMVEYLHEKCPKEIALLGGKIVKAPKGTPFPRITFKEAQEIFFKRTGVDERDEPDLSPAAERELCKYALEEFGTDFIFVVDWLASKRPFYSYKNEKDPSLTNTFDLLCAGGEVTSGGQRAHTYESMVEGIKDKEMDPEAFEDYLSVFKYGMPPHGGFGMGLERLTMMLLGLKNIREASLFPSDPKRIAGTRIKSKFFFGEENIRNEIVRLLKDNDMEFSHLKHEKSLTSEESAKIRGTLLEEGVKSLILKGKSSKKNYQFNLPAHMKVDMKAVAAAVGEKCEFENPDVIKERFGLLVGGVPPFGALLKLDTYFDESIAELSQVAFNCGFQTESLVMSAKDLLSITDAKLGVFSKE
jgi:nondiscriminating aspartyl-tRNA synthetase